MPASRKGSTPQTRGLATGAQPADVLPKLADDLEGFLAQRRGNAATASTHERQRVLRLLVEDVLIGPEQSPSATASRSGNGPPAAVTKTPTRRVTYARVIHCVGGVVLPLLANVYPHYVLDLQSGWQRRRRTVRWRILCRPALTTASAHEGQTMSTNLRMSTQ